MNLNWQLFLGILFAGIAVGIFLGILISRLAGHTIW